MPLYDFQCLSNHKFEKMVKLADFDTAQHCACGLEAKRLISKPRFSVDKTDYTCPITGKWVGSLHAHRENLAQHDCRVLETGETVADQRRRDQAEQRFEQSVEDTVEQQIEAMSSSKKEQLCNELVNGNVDLQVERK